MTLTFLHDLSASCGVIGQATINGFAIRAAYMWSPVYSQLRPTARLSRTVVKVCRPEHLKVMTLTDGVVTSSAT